MSQENLEIVRNAMKALEKSAQDGRPTPELLARSDEQIHVDATVRVFNPHTYDGHDGIKRLVREMHDSWDGFFHVPERLVGVDERVLSLTPWAVADARAASAWRLNRPSCSRFAMGS